MKNLIIDVCKKTIFSFNKQADGVSMDFCGGPVVANIIMTEFQKLILDDLINDNIIKFADDM